MLYIFGEEVLTNMIQNLIWLMPLEPNKSTERKILFMKTVTSVQIKH